MNGQTAKISYITMRPESPARACRGEISGRVGRVTRTSEPADSSPARYFFIHVMKTGGMALVANLSQNFTPDEVYPHPDLETRDFTATNVRFRALRIDYVRSLPAERRDRIRLYAAHFPFVACEVLGGGFGR